jgi:hypothetical protein
MVYSLGFMVLQAGTFFALAAVVLGGILFENAFFNVQ